MGRRKVEMKRIENNSSRQVTFSKRRAGLIKKAKELSVLCDVDLALLIFSSRGKLYEFSTTRSSIEIIQRYEKLLEEGKISEGEGYEAEKLHSECVNYLQSGELLQMVDKSLKEPYVEEISVTDLVQLESQLSAALILTKSRKTQLMMEFIQSLREKERMLREENGLLVKEIAAMEEDSNTNELVISNPPQRQTLQLL